MYYKIENTECEVYKKLHEMRSKELKIEEENKQAITEKTGLEWTGYLGHGGQQNLGRVTRYSGLKFKEAEKVNLKIWKAHSEHEGIFIPNRKTKAGREMAEFLSNGLKRQRWDIVHKILGLEEYGKVTFPFVEISKTCIILFLDDKSEPKDPNIIEITKREFNELFETA